MEEFIINRRGQIYKMFDSFVGFSVLEHLWQNKHATKTQNH